MKSTVFFLVFALALAAVHSQNKIDPTETFSFHPITLVKGECISDNQRAEIEQEVTANKIWIARNNATALQQRTTVHPLFILPFRAKAGFSDYGYYSLFNQVDQDLLTNGHLKDYNCGERTYDGPGFNHKGTDYVVWPYPWKKMEEDVMEVVAAAPGVIVVRKDGFFDKSCDNNGNPNWNGIILEHADGSRTYYWHFKNGSLTSKGLGDSVAAGEFLGRAGSSGSSDIPHLHFEVHDSNGALIDPYAGPCNTLNADSWWVEQPEYFIPEILTLSTHDSDNFDTDCGVVENTYEQLNFLPGDLVRFRIFYRDIRTNANTHITVKKPDGSILYDYDFTSTWPDYVVAYAQWNFPTDSSYQDGVYTVTAQFEGKTYETVFGINTNLGEEEVSLMEVSVYPNPTSGRLHIEGGVQIENIVVHDVLGRKVMRISPMAQWTAIDMHGLKPGVYFVSISAEGRKTVRKVIRE